MKSYKPLLLTPIEHNVIKQWHAVAHELWLAMNRNEQEMFQEEDATFDN